MPISVTPRAGRPFTDEAYALYCQINTGETRTFHVEGIERAEVIAG